MNPFPYPLDRLRADVGAGRIQEVIVAVPSLSGGLLGTRVEARYFLDVVVGKGVGVCLYLLAVDVEMATAPGYAIDAETGGYGDLLLEPDLGTLRLLPWDEGTALVIADAVTPEGDPVEVAPRRVLEHQIKRRLQRGQVVRAGTELEFLLFQETYGQAYARDYAGLTPAGRHNGDYALAGLEDAEPTLRRIRREMVQAGLRLETARGEVHPGQYEIVFQHEDALRAADNAALYVSGVRQIAAQQGLSATFMAKYDQGEGNSGHVHLSLRSAAGEALFASAEPDRTESPADEFAERHGRHLTPLMRQFLAGQLACLREFTLLFAPNVNSYVRLQPGAFAPTSVAWGFDNRLCPLRVVGRGDSLRFEHRVPGADANPYLSLAAILAAGSYGVEHGLELEPPTVGAPGPERPRVPTSIEEALVLWEGSAAAKSAFGEQVVAHYAAAGRAELEASRRAVTDWQRRRFFERG